MSDPILSPEEIVKKRAEKFKQLAARDLSDLKRVTDTPEGRRFVYRILRMCRTFGTIEISGRTVGLKIFDEVMRVAPQTYLQMDNEYKSEQKSINQQFPLPSEEENND